MMRLIGIVTLQIFLLVMICLIIPQVSFAHSVVKPENVTTSTYETFSLNVPTEKESSTIKVRLIIPASLKKVTPFVKSGWSITVKKEGSGTDEKVTEIEWVGGEIPVGQKDIFSFTALTPEKNTMLIWKAYQTYSDGEIVSWDQNPKLGEQNGSNPYSTTNVMSDKQISEKSPESQDSKDKKTNDYSLYISIAALAISVVGFVRRKEK